MQVGLNQAMTGGGADLAPFKQWALMIGCLYGCVTLFVAIVATLGVLAAPWRRWTLALAPLAVPWFKERNPGFEHHRFLRLLLERAVVDTASVAGQVVAGVRHGRLAI